MIGLIALIASLELGYLSTPLFEAGYTDLDVGIRIGNHFVITGGTETYFLPQSLFRYGPWQSDYRAGAKLEFGSVTIGYEHVCRHKVETGNETEWFIYRLPMEDRFFIRVQKEIE